MAQARALLALLAYRRGYSAAAAAAAARVRAAEEKAVMVAAKREADSAAKASWVPDPVTGYYRPGNRTQEVDAAELRETLLQGKGRA
ncbi:late embryogenesis abundant protein Lea5-like [Typha latifolia]|uniref:late embryogenesis abundant protein Lea5-like n=1 Tax=Typha latifolia TaxID=4733 RepID=UPI003C2C9F07